MLDDLDSIQWDQLTHAYGSADDVPDLIRALLSDDPDKRENAYGMLDMGVLHQGTIYTSTVAVIPFLIRLLDHPSTPDLHRLLGFLSDITSSAYHNLSEDALYLDVYRKLYKDNAEAMIQAEIEVRRQARLEIDRGIDLYFDALDHPDPLVAVAAFRLLTRIHPETRSIQRVVAVFESSDNPDTLIGFMLLAAALEHPLPAYIDTIKSICANPEQPPLARVAAAFALARLLKFDANAELFAAPAQFVADAPRLLDDLDGLEARELIPFRTGHLLRWLHDLRGKSAELWLVALLTLYPTTPPQSERYLTINMALVRNTILELAFAGTPLPISTLANELTPAQQSALQAIADRSQEWEHTQVTIRDDIFHTLASYNLVIETRDDLIAFLAGKRPARIL